MSPTLSASHPPTDSLSAFADAVCVPLKGDSGPFATLHVYRTGRAFTERDVKFIEAVLSTFQLPSTVISCVRPASGTPLSVTANDCTAVRCFLSIRFVPGSAFSPDWHDAIRSSSGKNRSRRSQYLPGKSFERSTTRSTISVVFGSMYLTVAAPSDLFLADSGGAHSPGIPRAHTKYAATTAWRVISQSPL